MVIKKTIVGYEEFINCTKEIVSDLENVNFLFSSSWCPDCVEAEPNITKALENAPEKSLFIYVDVGERTIWKDIKNPFRTDKDTHLSVIPTLIRWKNPQRLEGEQCGNLDLLEMFFLDD